MVSSALAKKTPDQTNQCVGDRTRRLYLDDNRGSCARDGSFVICACYQGKLKVFT